jgi:hypothetical protein
LKADHFDRLFSGEIKMPKVGNFKLDSSNELEDINLALFRVEQSVQELEWNDKLVKKAINNCFYFSKVMSLLTPLLDLNKLYLSYDFIFVDSGVEVSQHVRHISGEYWKCSCVFSLEDRTEASVVENIEAGRIELVNKFFLLA